MLLNVNRVFLDLKLCTFYCQAFQISPVHPGDATSPQYAFSLRAAGLIFDELMSTREILKTFWRQNDVYLESS